MATLCLRLTRYAGILIENSGGTYSGTDGNYGLELFFQKSIQSVLELSLPQSKHLVMLINWVLQFLRTKKLKRNNVVEL